MSEADEATQVLPPSTSGERVAQVRGLAPAERFGRIEPRREHGSPPAHRLVESGDEAVVGIGECDPRVGGTVGRTRGGRRLLNPGPLLPAVNGFENGFLQACRETVVLVKEVDAQRRGGRLAELLPVAARFGGAPDALLSHHPAQAVVEEKQGDRILVQFGLGPGSATVTGGQGDRFLMGSLADHSHRNAAFRRRELQVADVKDALGLVVEILHLPALRGGRQRGQQTQQRDQREAGHASTLKASSPRDPTPEPVPHGWLIPAPRPACASEPACSRPARPRSQAPPSHCRCADAAGDAAR